MGCTNYSMTIVVVVVLLSVPNKLTTERRQKQLKDRKGMQMTSWSQSSCTSSLSVWMIHECRGLHLGEILHLVKTRAKTGREIRCVEGAALFSLLRSGVSKVKFQWVCGGSWEGLWRGRGLSSQREGMESSDAHGCFLLVILGLGGAGTHSKHFPVDRKSKQKQVHKPASPRKMDT